MDKRQRIPDYCRVFDESSRDPLSVLCPHALVAGASHRLGSSVHCPSTLSHAPLAFPASCPVAASEAPHAAFVAIPGSRLESLETLIAAAPLRLISKRIRLFVCPYVHHCCSCFTAHFLRTSVAITGLHRHPLQPSFDLSPLLVTATKVQYSTV